MSIQATCGQCHAVLKIKEKYAGRRGSCPHCGGPLVVPPLSPEGELTACDPESGDSLASLPRLDAAPRDEPPEATLDPTSAPPPKDRSMEAVLDSLDTPLPPRRITPLYRLGILAVAGVMVLLPALYVGIAVAVGWLLYRHATHNVAIADSAAGAVLYLLPLVAGVILLFFLLKPLLARRRQETSPQPLTREDEPVLFSLVERLCNVVNAPKPTKIYVDCRVNAAAGFGFGRLAVFSRDIVLVLGLPLAADLNLRQFAGVLAHELAHFSQGAAARLDYLVRRINAWFAHVVYERDLWDDRLARWSTALGPRIGLVFRGARYLIWATRGLLWLLMMAGHAVCQFMTRQTEFDADRCGGQVVGTKAYAGTLRRLSLLGVAGAVARDDLENMWSEGRLVDNLPGLIAAGVEQLDPEIVQEVDKQFAEGKTGFFDTHPSDKDRNAAILGDPTPGIITDQRPAREIFADFDTIAKSTTLEHYRHVLGEAVDRAHLIDVNRHIRGRGAHRLQDQAAITFFRGSLSWMRPVGLTQMSITRVKDSEALVRAIVGTRKRMQQAHPEYDAALERLANIRGRLAVAWAADKAIAAGFTLAPGDLNLTEPSRAAARQAVNHAIAEMNDVETTFAQFEDATLRRFRAAFSLLIHACVQFELEDGARLKRRARRLLRIGQAVEKTIPQLLWLDAQSAQLAILTALASAKDKLSPEQQIHPVVARETPAIVQHMKNLVASLEEIEYPYEHAEGMVTVAHYAVGDLPQGDEPAEVYLAAREILSRMTSLYFRLVAGLAQLAVRAEVAAGLPKPEAPREPDAGNPVEQQKSKTVDPRTRASHPGLVPLSDDKLQLLEPALFPGDGIAGMWYGLSNRRQIRFWRTHIKEHLLYGDSRAAKVISVAPLLVAAYTSELDCVALLRFPDAFVDLYGLKPGTKLLTVNTYERMTAEGMARDLEQGPRALGQYCNFVPFIAEFLSEDMIRIQVRKREIDDSEWERCEEMGQQYFARHGGKARNGRPTWCAEPAW